MPQALHCELPVSACISMHPMLLLTLFAVSHAYPSHVRPVLNSTQKAQ